MATRLIELSDGLLVEVQADPDETRQIAATAAERVEAAIDQARDLLLTAVKPVASVWDELNRDLTIDEHAPHRRRCDQETLRHRLGGRCRAC